MYEERTGGGPKQQKRARDPNNSKDYLYQISDD